MANLAESVSQHVSSVETAAQPRYLDFNGALAELRSLGFAVTESQLRKWIWKRELPFFPLGKKLHIDRTELQMHFRALQTQAVKEMRARSGNHQKRVARR